jgi:hypothetical protein
MTDGRGVSLNIFRDARTAGAVYAAVVEIHQKNEWSESVSQ